MSLGKEYEKGTVLFDRITVMGKDFLPSSKNANHYYGYVVEVNPYLNKDVKRKKGDPEQYDYNWNGHININLGRKVHLHSHDIPMDKNDIGLVDFENKLVLFKETIKDFIKEYKARLKEPAKKDVTVKKWLNNPNDRFTSYIAYFLDKEGSGTISFSSCDTIQLIWIFVDRDEKGKAYKDQLSFVEIKAFEELCKGIDKNINAIKQLRKFFEREVFDVTEK